VILVTVPAICALLCCFWHVIAVNQPPRKVGSERKISLVGCHSSAGHTHILLLRLLHISTLHALINFIPAGLSNSLVTLIRDRTRLLRAHLVVWKRCLQQYRDTSPGSTLRCGMACPSCLVAPMAQRCYLEISIGIVGAHSGCFWRYPDSFTMEND
jgi:hypothetical protein